MLKIQEIREIIKLIDQSSINEFKFENDGMKINLKKNGQEVETVVQKVVQEKVAQPVQQVEAQPVAETVAPVQTKEVVQEAVKQVETENLHKITSPMVGTFYSSPNPDASPYVSPGSKVDHSTVVCIVEAMKLFNEIEAEVKGEIVEVLVENGQLVEYGQPLFLVKPE
ncbi:acetyl-CoA carboxylase biotin carboxyl carrier protein [Bacillus sp. FJAT-47783]|uniref:acetyl-CoA carboxylase biotin carboxyl carrier protein n=1 Tax=Bacillus sp. FJAT-47783 TaxID=2922712 RepID=UPI001FAB4C4B|nr:acetyl-CoA carboxylase biotin carboxyl carrier protein [Bacillus sp. FJAT-47783]